ncbi:uncharacterized protein Dana_GF23574, isoform B [Drosophila ananassae]|uniref:Uncharacterized protein, isoform B n=1 Tax=Drosophila ananassae TaxID=7217 RepID=A0A0P8XW72_DROAN|nr:titin isoform X2 [Drosophila ananassae]KPU78961.1 uncharacterized protein Dana_GF23574, isoform B [Drosophila ananassae]
MDKPELHSFMGPPPAVANSSNNNAAASFPEASSAGDKSAPPPKRIIKKINLDFKKLKESGLDRKLAEALSKHSPGAKPAKSSIPSAPAAAAASASASPSTSTAAQQKPQLRQPAPQPIKKRAMVSDYIEKIVPGQTNVDSSMHVKALLKSRILNKSMGGMPAKYSASRPPPSAALGSPDSSPTPGVFSVPIAKADVTVRQKQPPLLLNLVNKLPKCRSLCTSSSYSSQKRSTSKEQQGVPPKAPEISQKPAPSTPVVPQRNCTNTIQEHNNMTTSPHPLPPPQLTPQTPIVLPQSSKSSLPPLIVLENKVLSPDEKIDLSSLAIQQVKPLEKTDVISPPVQAPISTNPAKGKVILSTQKLKLSREKLSEMANEIRNQVKKVEAIPQLETVPTFNASLNTKPSNVEPLTINKECTPEVYNSTMETPTVKSGDVSLFSSPVKQSKELLSSESVEVSTDTLLITEPEEVPVYNPCTPEPEELLEVTNIETKTATPETNQLSKEDTSTSTSKVLSAVDFIAQLTAENTLDDSSFMELSPEEQRLNALFGGGGGFGVSSAMPVQEPEKVEVNTEIQKELPRPEPTVFVETPADEELAIGKILKMDDVNILHATLDVNSDSTNILRISPNAVKLQKSVEVLEKIAEEPNYVEADEVPSEKPNLAANILVEQPKNSNDVEVPSEMRDPEPEKEVTPPVRKQPMRSKRAKINLVQRTKRPSAAKATEAKRPKPEFEENDEPAAEAERNGDMEIEVSSDEGRSKEVNDLGVEPDKEQSQRTTQQDEPEVEEEENEGASKPPTDRDLTQLYHPPKMPKNKSRKQNQNLELLDDPQPSTTGSNVSLIDILSQEQPPPQGEAKIPFRKEPEEGDSITCSTPEAKGIQNLISHLEAEKVPTQTKKTSPSSEETPKVGSRKKLVKTRPILGKRSARVAQNSQPEKTTSCIDPVPISIDVRSRVPTSSTSDDDRSETVELEEKRTRTPVLSFQIAQKKINETDISDDASPDHDETEDEQLSHVKKPQAMPEVTKSEEKVEIHNQGADDSDSSSPRDFSESVAINEDLIQEEHPSEEPTKDVSSEPGGGDTSSVVEENLEDSFRKLKDAKTVINEKVSPIPENSTRRSRRSTKKASEKELSKRESEIENNVSTEKQEESTVEKSKGKRQSRASLKAQKTLILPEESKESEISIAVSSAAEETKIPEEPTTSVKSLRQRQSRSRTPKVANISTGEISQPTDSSVENIETKEEKESASDNCKSKRKSRSCNSKKTVSKDLEKVEDNENTKTVTGDKKVPDEDKSAEVASKKPSRKRASRSKTPKCIEATPPAEKPINSSDKQGEGELYETPQTTEEPEIIPQTREKRKSRSRKAIPDKSKDSQERENPVSKPEEVDTSQSVTTNLTEVSTTEESADKTEDLAKESVPEEFKLPEKSVKPKATRRSRIKESQPESLQSPVINQEVANESDVVPSPVQSKRQRRSRCAEPKYVDEANSAMKRKSRSQPDPETAPIPLPKDEEIQTPKRRRKEPETPKAEDVEPPSLDTPKTPARRGRKRAAEADCELAKKLKEEGITVTPFNLRLLLVRKREQLETEEVVTCEGEGDGPLQCGLCLARSSTENWQNHLLEHYGVGWLIENTPELITRSSAMAMMKAFLQKNPEKRLVCRMCNNKLTSAQGMILHLESCAKKLAAVEDTFNVRLLLIRKRQQLETEEELTDEGKGDGPLQCGLCLARSTTENWQNHLLEHYGVGWFTDEQPEAITRSWVIRKMKDYLIINPEKRFACRMCNHQLTTAMGMMLHLENCGRQRVECEFCRKLYAFMSLPQHLRTCPRRPKDGIKEEQGKEIKEPVSCHASAESTFSARLLLIRKREQLETDEVLTNEGEGSGSLQCGLCLASSTSDNWQNHLLEHYGVGWFIDEQPEIITRGLVIKKMKDFLQKNPEKRLGCRLCNQQLTSAMGMMLHLENCGRQRVKCEFCKKLYASMTLPQHLRVCAKRSMIEKANEQDPAEESKELVYSNAGRAKRKSTIKAETKLKKIGEALTSENSAMETDQQKDFDGDSSDYDMAMDKESSDEYASEGADSNEDPILSEAESEGKGNKRSKKSKANDASRKKNSRKRPVFLGDVSEKPLFSRYINLELRIENRWKKFLQISYAKGSLFPQFEPSYSIISLEEAQTLLPSNDSKSMRYAFGGAEKSGDWKQMGLFEGFMNDGEYIGYLGGAIKQLAWAPLPSQVKTQYLLCSLRTKLKSYTKHVKIEGKEDALLMLLKCSVPDHNPSDNFSALQLDLHYGVRVPNGPVHSFVFMPSGGYDESTNRLGLLAVSNSMSDVHIYALPLNLPGDEQTGTESNVIQLNSLLTLSLDITNPVQDQCTRICWSQARGHNFLVTGYAKGNVACWDIGDTEGLNCIKQDNQLYIAPLNFFFIGERNIQYLDLHYDANGPRWLAVGTNVRRFCIFDIKNWSQPYPLVEGSSISHLYVTSLFWSPICETIIVGSNELFVNRMTRNLALSPSGINYDYKTLESTVSSTRAMHSNIQKNYLVLGTDNGDLVFVDERDLNFPPALNKSAFIVRAVSTLDLVHLSEATSDPKDPITPETFFRDYALRIKPVVPVQPKGRTTYLSEKRMPKNLTSLPLTRYNCVHCNWNSPANSLVAVGTEHGLLRILNFQRDKFFQRQP